VNLRAINTLHLALGASIAVHGVLLTVRFVDPEAFNRVFEDTPLEVILVNARSNETPEKAKAIAQASLAGGGDAEKGRATSPLPPSTLNDVGEITEQEASRKLEVLQEQQNLLLAQIKNQLATMPAPTNPTTATKPGDIEREEKRRQLVQLLAEIEQRVNQQNARPKKRYISPATREEAYAVYYDKLRRAIEDKGTQSFPQQNGKKIYGELTMVVTVNHDGRVIDTEVAESSGNRALDRHAATIVRSAGPFGAFTPGMRKQSDQVVVVSRFKFTREDGLQTKLSAQP
jgi:periplasmic protein TonB